MPSLNYHDPHSNASHYAFDFPLPEKAWVSLLVKKILSKLCERLWTEYVGKLYDHSTSSLYRRDHVRYCFSGAIDVSNYPDTYHHVKNPRLEWKVLPIGDD